VNLKFQNKILPHMNFLHDKLTEARFIWGPGVGNCCNDHSVPGKMFFLTGRLLQEQSEFHFHSCFNHFLCVEKLLSIPILACEASLLKLEFTNNPLTEQD